MEELEYDDLEDDILDETQLVSFKLADEEFGISINEVQEIIRMKPLTHIPGSNSFIEGVIDLRGNILPIIDLRKKLNMPVKENDDLTRIIVVSLNNVTTGLIVDTVSEVLRISDDMIKKAPSLLGSNAKYITGFIRLNSHLIVLLDVKNIISEEDIIKISNITKQLNQEEKHQDDIEKIEEEKIVEPQLCKWEDKKGVKCTRFAMKGSEYCEIHQPGA